MPQTINCYLCLLCLLSWPFQDFIDLSVWPYFARSRSFWYVCLIIKRALLQALANMISFAILIVRRRICMRHKTTFGYQMGRVDGLLPTTTLAQMYPITNAKAQLVHAAPEQSFWWDNLASSSAITQVHDIADLCVLVPYVWNKCDEMRKSISCSVCMCFTENAWRDGTLATITTVHFAIGPFSLGIKLPPD